MKDSIAKENIIFNLGIDQGGDIQFCLLIVCIIGFSLFSISFIKKKIYKKMHVNIFAKLVHYFNQNICHSFRMVIFILFNPEMFAIQ